MFKRISSLLEKDFQNEDISLITQLGLETNPFFNQNQSNHLKRQAQKELPLSEKTLLLEDQFQSPPSHIKWLDAIVKKQQIHNLNSIPCPNTFQTVSKPPSFKSPQVIENDPCLMNTCIYDVYIEERPDQFDKIENYAMIETFQGYSDDENELDSSEDIFEDEDSNAEDYWMNDYPEESGECPSSMNEDEDHSLQREDLIYDELGIRRDGKVDTREIHLMNDYERRIRKEFSNTNQEDSMEELSSDDQQDYIYWGSKLNYN
jgi:hypothetical protein